MRLVTRLAPVGVVGKKLVKHNSVRPGATDRERITHDRPLRLAVEAKDFSEIMNQAGQNEPARMPVATDLLRCLKQVIELGEVRIRIAVIHQRIQKLQRLPHPHLPPLEPQKLLPLALPEVLRLMPMIPSIKPANGRP